MHMQGNEPIDCYASWKLTDCLLILEGRGNASNVHICKWTDLRDNCHDDDPLFIDKESADAKTQHLRGQADYLVVYDDRVENYQRIRWTIAHEIGHIVLGHLTSFEATAVSRKPVGAEYKVLEREADTFAVISWRYDHNNQAAVYPVKADFMELCDLSGQASDNCMEELRLLKSGKSCHSDKGRGHLHRLFFRFINELTDGSNLAGIR